MRVVRRVSFVVVFVRGSLCVVCRVVVVACCVLFAACV